MFHQREIPKSQSGDIHGRTSSTPSQHERPARKASLRFSGESPEDFAAGATQQAKELQGPPSMNTRSNGKWTPFDEKKAPEGPKKRIRQDVAPEGPKKRIRRDVKTIVPDQASALEDLKKKYLLVGDNDLPPTFEDSKITFIIDGKEYFQRVDKLIRSAQKGDAVYIAGRYFEAEMDLQGRSKDDAGYYPIDRLLAEKAADGVDVLLMLAAGTVASWIPGPAGFRHRENYLAAEHLRTSIPQNRGKDKPLASRVLLDVTGENLGSNHQKLVFLHTKGQIKALVGGIDFCSTRYDQSPHDTLKKKRAWGWLKGEAPWGWHDAAVLIEGPAAKEVLKTFVLRWKEANDLYPRYVMNSKYLFPKRMNPSKLETPKTLEELDEELEVTGILSNKPNRVQKQPSEVSIQVLRSFGPHKRDSLLPFLREGWSRLPEGGVQEIYKCVTKAINAAEKYIYITDQYLSEKPGGKPEYEIYPHLMEAAKRGVKVILVGSGECPPDDDMFFLKGVNLTVSADIQKKVLDPLPPAARNNVGVYQLKGTTLHEKACIIDDKYACIGSANMFSRSMSGVDIEENVAVVTAGTQVRDLRAKEWGEHSRLKNPKLLNNLDFALGIWDEGWVTSGQKEKLRRLKRIENAKQVLTLVGPERTREG